MVDDNIVPTNFSMHARELHVNVHSPIYSFINFDRPTRATQTIQLAFEDSAAALHIVCLAQILIRLDNLVAHAKRQVGYQLTTVPVHYYHLTTMLTFLYLVIYAVNEGSHVYVACVQHDVLLGLARLLAGIIYIYIISAMWYVAVMVSDPTGNDTCDFDLAFDLRQHVRYAMSAM